MIAQDVVRTGDFTKERRSGPYDRLTKISCADKRQARAREIHETCGLAAGLLSNTVLGLATGPARCGMLLTPGEAIPWGSTKAILDVAPRLPPRSPLGRGRAAHHRRHRQPPEPRRCAVGGGHVACMQPHRKSAADVHAARSRDVHVAPGRADLAAALALDGGVCGPLPAVPMRCIRRSSAAALNPCVAGR